MRSILGAILLLLLSFSSYAIDPPAIPQSPASLISNKVVGLELPEPITVDSNEGFLLIEAKAKGQVKWFVICSNKVKYVTNDASNSLIVSVPQSGSINIFAIALVDNKLTDFARTDVTVKSVKPDPVNPTPVDPEVVPEKVSEGLHITFLLDYNESSPDLASVLNSKDIRDEITKTKSFFKVYDVNSPIVKDKKMDVLLKKTGNTLLVIQKNDGTVLYYSAIPKTDKEVIAILNKITKGE